MSEQIREEWRNVPGCEGKYRISNLGRVFSVRSQMIMKLSKRGGAYTRVCLKGCRTSFLHQLVLEVFVGPRPAGLQAAHLNGNREENAVSNLAWVTRSENELHKKIHGTALCGERNHQRKLTADKVREMRKLSEAGMSNRRIGERFGVSKEVARCIVRRTSWAHVA